MENLVENPMEQGNVSDDAALVPMQAEAEPLSSLDELVETPQSKEASPPETQPTPPVKEPGWIKQRINKEVDKAIRATEERMTQKFEATLAPIRESVMERQAEELVAQGEFKTKERALEYVRLKGGIVVPATVENAAPTPEQPPRDAQGRFAPRQEAQDPVMQARADLLAAQAEKIKANRGLDVMATFNGDPDTQQKILSGEWDFYDVAEAMAQRGERQSMPSPTRSAHGATGGKIDINSLSAEQFNRLQENLKAGAIYDFR